MSEQAISDLPAETPADGSAAEIVSFSQLPFVRPKPPSAAAPEGSSSPTSSSIRLFGFDFPPDAGGAASSSSVTTNGDAAAAPGQAASTGGSRKFECHYCCRNFPTSQALGGHQNAHKRERQHAKRAQFQSTMAMQHGHYSAYPAFAGAGGYHHRFLAAPPPHIPPPHYPSWSANMHLAPPPPMVPASRYYGGGPGSVSEPINGSPVPASALWRLPAGALNVAAGAAPVPPPRQEQRPSTPARRDEMMAVAAWGSRRGVTQAAGSASSASSASSSSQHEARHGAGDTAERRANVSLDLTL